MARAAVKAKQQARAKQKQQPAKAATRGRRRRSGGGNPNQQLFFERMRRHAKWAYVGLALLFAITFAGLGVGSGSSGLSGLFNGINIFGGSSGTSVSKAQKEIAKNPAKGYRDLATAYEQKGDNAGAIAALKNYTALKKKDANAFAELGGLQLQQGQQFATAYQQAAQQQQLTAPSQPFLPTGTLGTAIGQNKIEQVAYQQLSGTTSALYQQALTSYQDAISSYTTVTKLRPNDANAQFQLANAAQTAGDYTVAVAALKKYLKLNPATTQRTQIEQLIKQLSPAAPTPATKQKSSGK